MTTRAQALRDRVTIALAENRQGEEIATVLKDNGLTLNGADWSGVYPHWLVAVVEGQVIGCCLIMIAKPVGFCEFLLVRREVPFKLRAIAIHKLMTQAQAVIGMSGAQYVGMMVGVQNGRFSNVLEKNGFTQSAEINLFARRI